MHYFYLSVAIVCEVVATMALSASQGLTRLSPILIMAAGYALSFAFLALSLREIPLGIAYAIWSGTGIVLITIAGWFLFGQRIPATALFGIGFIMIGVLLVHTAEPSRAAAPLTDPDHCENRCRDDE